MKGLPKIFKVEEVEHANYENDKEEGMGIYKHDEELHSLINLRTTLSSILLMLENARDDIVLFNKRCHQLNEASQKCRDATLQIRTGDSKDKNSVIMDTPISKEETGSKLVKSIHMGGRSKP